MATATSNRERATAIAVFGGVAATLATGVACIAPMAGILLGVGGLGFLTRYAWLRVPASIATALFLITGFVLFYRHSASACKRISPRKRKLIGGLLWSGTVFALVTNLFEYVIFPQL